jgi:hypothetical protein
MVTRQQLYRCASAPLHIKNDSVKKIPKKSQVYGVLNCSALIIPRLYLGNNLAKML